MHKLIHGVPAYIFVIFFNFISVAYATLNKLLVVFHIRIFAVSLTKL